MRGNTEVLFERDPQSGTVTTFVYDDDTDTFTLRESQDVRPLLEINKYLSSMGRSKAKFAKKVASIPLTTLGQMWTSWRDRGLSHEEKMAELTAWLNDSDHAKFRSDGRAKL